MKVIHDPSLPPGTIKASTDLYEQFLQLPEATPTPPKPWEKK